MTDPHLPDPPANGAVPPPSETTAAVKRHRRPSVRLGEIGDDPIPVRSRKKSTKGGGGGSYEEERETMTWRGREPKAKGNKRVRSGWGFSRGGGDDVDGFDDEEDENEDVNNSPLQSLEYRGVSSKGGPSDDNDTRNYWNGGGGERNGIRVWLNQLGLGRYAPVFEIHEVDDEVLPMLTIEDLKDMGINAVGSRRKMYSAIQKLNKGFS